MNSRNSAPPQVGRQKAPLKRQSILTSGFDFADAAHIRKIQSSAALLEAAAAALPNDPREPKLLGGAAIDARAPALLASFAAEDLFDPAIRSLFIALREVWGSHGALRWLGGAREAELREELVRRAARIYVGSPGILKPVLLQAVAVFETDSDDIADLRRELELYARQRREPTLRWILEEIEFWRPQEASLPRTRLAARGAAQRAGVRGALGTRRTGAARR